MTDKNLDKVIDVEYREIKEPQLPPRWICLVTMGLGLAILLNVASGYPAYLQEQREMREFYRQHKPAADS